MRYILHFTAGLLVAACVACCCLANAALAQPAPAYVITIEQAIDPVETGVAEEVKLRFRINVADDEGNPAQLDVAIDIAAELAAASDPDSGLSTLSASDVFHLPAGFTGGTRMLITAVTGDVPPAPVILNPAVSFSTLAPGVELDAAETASLQVRSLAQDSGGEFDFCIVPGRGERGNDPLLFNDFRRVLVVAHVSGAGLPTATVLAGVEIDVVEVVDGVETAQPEIVIAMDPNTRTVDSDNDGFAEGITAVFRLVAESPVAVAINQERDFRVRVRHTDGINVAALGEADFSVERRESTSAGGVAVVGADTAFSVRFERRQSRVFNFAPKLQRNGVNLNAAANATVTVAPDLLNAIPGDESGRFGLGWTVRVDWPRLQTLIEWQQGDTLTVSANMPGEGNSAAVTREVAIDGINATIFKTPESLADKQYNDNVTEQDHVDTLVAALKAAGLVARRTSAGDEVEIPSILADPADDGYPNWARVRRTLRAIKNAVKAYKTAPRILGTGDDAVDCLEGQKEWDVCVTIQCPLVDADGEAVEDDDGNPIIKDINLKIFFNPQRTGRNGQDTSGTDDGKPCTLLIVIGQCGQAEGGNPGNGGKADGTITGRGSVGIAVGGDGSSNRDNPDSGEKGGDGGTGGVTVGKKPSKAADGPGPTGVAIGGDGGDTVGPQAKPGNGGDAGADSDNVAGGSIVSGGGDSGHGEIPPPKGGHTSGTARVKNGDSVTSDGKRKAVERKSNRVTGGGQRGRITGGIARGEKDKTPDSTDGNPVPNPNPLTGD